MPEGKKTSTQPEGPTEENRREKRQSGQDQRSPGSRGGGRESCWEGGPPTDRGRRGASKPGEQPSRGTEAGRAETATRTTAPASRSPRPETLGRGLGTETRALGVRPSAPQRGPGRLCGNSLRGWEACQAGGLGPPERQDATAGGQKQGHYHPRNLLFCTHMDSQAAGTTVVPGGAGAAPELSTACGLVVHLATTCRLPKSTCGLLPPLPKPCKEAPPATPTSPGVTATAKGP